jgi:hypothetical protein
MVAALEVLAGGFVIQPEVKMGVEQLAVAFGGLRVSVRGL